MARLVTFDVTNTCIRVAKSAGYHYARVAKEFGVKAQVDSAFWTAIKETNGCQLGISCKDWWGKVATSTFTAVGVQDKDTKARIGDKLYSDFAGAKNWVVFPDVHPTLQQLKAAGITLGAISNFDERLGTILSSLGLAKHFDFILASYEVGCAKPDPRIFELALEKASVEPSKAIHVGTTMRSRWGRMRTVTERSYARVNVYLPYIHTFR